MGSHDDEYGLLAAEGRGAEGARGPGDTGGPGGAPGRGVPGRGVPGAGALGAGALGVGALREGALGAGAAAPGGALGGAPDDPGVRGRALARDLDRALADLPLRTEDLVAGAVRRGVRTRRRRRAVRWGAAGAGAAALTGAAVLLTLGGASPGAAPARQTVALPEFAPVAATAPPGKEALSPEAAAALLGELLRPRLPQGALTGAATDEGTAAGGTAGGDPAGAARTPGGTSAALSVRGGGHSGTVTVRLRAGFAQDPAGTSASDGRGKSAEGNGAGGSGVEGSGAEGSSAGEEGAGGEGALGKGARGKDAEGKGATGEGAGEKITRDTATGDPATDDPATHDPATSDPATSGTGARRESTRDASPDASASAEPQIPAARDSRDVLKKLYSCPADAGSSCVVSRRSGGAVLLLRETRAKTPGGSPLISADLLRPDGTRVLLTATKDTGLTAGELGSAVVSERWQPWVDPEINSRTGKGNSANHSADHMN